MQKNKSYLLLGIFSFILSLTSWLFVTIFQISYSLRTVILRNINGDNQISLSTSQNIEKGLFDYLGSAHNTYLNFESGPLHFLPQALIFIFLLIGILFIVLALKNKK